MKEKIFTVKNIVATLWLIIAILTLCPVASVSVVGVDAISFSIPTLVKGVSFMGMDIVPSMPYLLIFTFIPVAAAVLLFIKKIQSNPKRIISVVTAAIMLIFWIVFIIVANSKLSDSSFGLASASVGFGFILSIIILVILGVILTYVFIKKRDFNEYIGSTLQSSNININVKSVANAFKSGNNTQGNAQYTQPQQTYDYAQANSYQQNSYTQPTNTQQTQYNAPNAQPYQQTQYGNGQAAQNTYSQPVQNQQMNWQNHTGYQNQAYSQQTQYGRQQATANQNPYAQNGPNPQTQQYVQYCRVCGSPIYPGAYFCIKCGTRAN